MRNSYHRLLRSQLKKAGLENESNPKFDAFLSKVNRAYHEFNDDFSHLENILEKSSQELYSANKKLISNVEAITSKLENVADNIKEIIFETDINGNWLYLNPAWKTLTGYEVHDSIGRLFTDFTKNIRWENKDAHKKLLRANFQEMHETLKITMSKGEEKWLDVSLQKTYDNNDIAIGYIGTIVDISEQKQTELALIEAKNKEVKANQAKDEFLSTISHEIRTPLNAIIGISHLLFLENPKKSQLENLTALNYSSEHLLSLVNDILDFNKIESGNIKLENTIFNIENILKALQSTFGRLADEKNIQFLIEKDDFLPTLLIGDSTRFSQIITNLISNAIKFTEKGSVIFKIKVASKNLEKVNLEFEVIDTGIGIKPEKKETIFDAFVQANSDTTRKYGGSGLGLAISKKLLLLMNSSIHLESTIGKGTTFSFSLNLEIHNGLYNKKDNINNDLINLEDLENISVLVAEDHKLNILVIKKFLCRWKVNFDIAENGQIAVEKASEKRYDLILMDLQMPIMNGFEATKKIRQLCNYNAHTPIIALSASAAVDVQKETKDYGIDGHINKPFDPTILYQTLRSIKPLSPKKNRK